MQFRKAMAAASLVVVSAAAFIFVDRTVSAQKAPRKPAGVAPGRVVWPSMQQQIDGEYLGRKVTAGSQLETLIKSNQETWMLNTGEQNVRPLLPSWIRIWWRKQHPEGTYSTDDPTGGYPHVLNEILEWMMTHQDLRVGPGEAAMDEVDDGPSILAPSLLAPETVGTNVRLSGSQTAARSESDIRINYFDPLKILSASNNIASGGRQGVYASLDGGVTWTQALLPLTSPDTLHSDPTADWTNDGRAWSSTLGINGGTLKLRTYVSSDNGATWTLDATVSGAQTNVDKQMEWVDHSPSSPYFGRIYAIWHNGNPAYMNRRTAGVGGAWLATPITLTDAGTGTRIGGDVKTNANGDVFGFYPDTGTSKIYVVKSTDGGSSFSTAVAAVTTKDSYDIGVPSFSSRRALIYASGGAYRNASKNNVYVTWTDLSGASGCTAPANEPGTNTASTCKTRVWFARSTDGGTTWGTPIKINDQASLNDQFNQWMVVDETTGTIGVMYYDTVNDSGRKKTDIWFQTSADDGVTWAPAQKVTSSPTDETVSGADSGNQYGDYNGLSGYAGAFFPVWTDRRSGSKEEIWTAKIATPTAATVSVSGRVLDRAGNGVRSAIVTIQDQNGGMTRNAITNAFGFYTFNDVQSGTAYILNATSRQYRFSPRVITLVDSLADVNFTP
ncbi:MAG: carboxypeptidase regulatory-like domain-containing protein [Acidobacteria bacterium]|nr:carboxypeptidase regulatory-like domain-containing protein [Acidobacteriota bacterium]